MAPLPDLEGHGLPGLDQGHPPLGLVPIDPELAQLRYEEVSSGARHRAAVPDPQLVSVCRGAKLDAQGPNRDRPAGSPAQVSLRAEVMAADQQHPARVLGLHATRQLGPAVVARSDERSSRRRRVRAHFGESSHGLAAGARGPLAGEIYFLRNL
jgi:hypothetical protein